MPSGAWTLELERQLLLALIDTPDTISRAKLEEAAAKLGNGLTWNACR